MTRAKYVNIMAKVTGRTKERLDAVCVKYHFKSNYELLQYLVSAFLRYAAPDIYADADPEEVAQLLSMFAEAKNVKGPAKKVWYAREDKRPAYIICSYNVGNHKNAYTQCVRFSNKRRPMVTEQYDAPLMLVLSTHFPKMDAVIQARRKRNPWKSYLDIFEEIIDRYTNEARPEEAKNRASVDI